MRIDTEINDITLEIDDNEYALAPRTIELCDKLAQLEKKLEGQPLYRLWLAELELLLGKAAIKQIFPNGQRENVDRIYAIYRGAARAFRYNSDAMDSDARADELERYDGAIERVERVGNAIGEINTLLARQSAQPERGGVKEIHKP